MIDRTLDKPVKKGPLPPAVERADCLKVAELLALAGVRAPAAAFDAVERALWRAAMGGGDPTAALRVGEDLKDASSLHGSGPLRRLWLHSASQHKRTRAAVPSASGVEPPLGEASRPWRFLGGSGGGSGGGAADRTMSAERRGVIALAQAAGPVEAGHQAAPRPADLFSDPTLPLVVDVGCGPREGKGEGEEGCCARPRVCSARPRVALFSTGHCAVVSPLGECKKK